MCRIERPATKNPRQFPLFLAFCFYVLNVNEANDAQRVILLSSLIQLRVLQTQLPLWNWQRRRRRRGLPFPSFWVLPRPQQSWFDIHYFDPTIPGDYFRRRPPLKQNTFSVPLNILRCGMCCLKNNCPGLLGSSFDHNGCPKTGKIVPKSWIYDYP